MLSALLQFRLQTPPVVVVPMPMPVSMTMTMAVPIPHPIRHTLRSHGDVVEPRGAVLQAVLARARRVDLARGERNSMVRDATLVAEVQVALAADMLPMPHDVELVAAHVAAAAVCGRRHAVAAIAGGGAAAAAVHMICYYGLRVHFVTNVIRIHATTPTHVCVVTTVLSAAVAVLLRIRIRLLTVCG